MNEKQLTHKKHFSCFFMDLYEDKVELPNGKEGNRIYIEHPGAAAVMPLTTDHKILMIRQFRYPIRQVIIEIPAGKKDDVHESGLDCVVRELEEETGYRAKRYEKFVDIHNCLGYSNEMIELFFAFDIYPIENPKPADDDEFIEIFFCDYNEAKTLLDTKQITDAKTIIMLQEYLRRYQP